MEDKNLREEIAQLGQAVIEQGIKLKEENERLSGLLRQRFARSSPIEEELMLAGMGKRPLPTKEECLEWAAKLGIPDEFRKK